MVLVAILKAPVAEKVDYQIDGRLFRRIWRLAKPFWTRKEQGVWLARLAFIAVLAFLPIMSGLSAGLSFVTRDMTNALIAKHAAEYWRYFFLMVFATAGMSISLTGIMTLEGWLNQNWRRWLTMHLIDQYLAKRTYYDIALAEDLDNPDQRIQENVLPFISAVIGFPRMILLNVTIILTGIGVLSTINLKMIPVAIGFGIIQSLVIYFTYTPTIKKNYDIMLAEADFRYGVLHVRDHAEAVAFYSGEAAERVHIFARLQTAVYRNLNLIYYNALVVMGSTSGLSLIWSVLPYLVLVPLYFAGHLSYGSIAQAVVASSQILGGLTALANFVPTLAQAAPQAVRLAQIQERFDLMEQGRKDATSSRLSIRQTANHVRLRNVTLETPGGEQTLVRDLSLTLEPGENLVVIGQTGVGKSSLLRAMGGLWTRGSGTIEMPHPSACLFLPQRPYMILADLRSQLFYPHGDTRMSDADLQKVLETVNLTDLAEKYGGLSAVRDWGKVLSLGEQQRIGFARVLISRPKFAFLDEATSAVDFATETRLYELLARTGVSFVSVGHRLSIIDYHTHVLTLIAGGEWKLAPLTGTGAEDAKRLLVS